MLSSRDGRSEQERCEDASATSSGSAQNQTECTARQVIGAADVPQEMPGDASHPPPLPLVITILQTAEISKPSVSTSKSVASEGAAAAKKGFLSRSSSYQEQEQCRVCQQQTEETLIDLGCRCRGELAKAHRSCIDIWFHTKGSNKCEICQQIAANVPLPSTLQTSSNWIWRMNSAYARGQERERRCFSPLWVAFAILVGGLLLDVLVSVSLGVSALPVNIIIGVLIVLGLGTSFRLALECCQEWGSRRNLRTSDLTLNPVYHPTV